jgi:hypothetical protein
MRRATRALLATAAASLLVCETAGFACADDDSPPAPESRSWEISVVDNSHADSWLEVDRTLNDEVGSGTAGSDHDGNETRSGEASSPLSVLSGAPGPSHGGETSGRCCEQAPRM